MCRKMFGKIAESMVPNGGVVSVLDSVKAWAWCLIDPSVSRNGNLNHYYHRMLSLAISTILQSALGETAILAKFIVCILIV